jgi:hypothetical protein
MGSTLAKRNAPRWGTVTLVMKLATVACAAVLGLAACSSEQSSPASSPTSVAPNRTPTSTQESPSPLPATPLSGQLIITGGLTFTFSYSNPPQCQVLGQQSLPTTLSSAVEVLINFSSGSSFVQIMMRSWHGVGTYAPNSLGNESYVLYSSGGSAADSWTSVQGTIDVKQSSTAVISGTVDADLTALGDTASSSRGATAHVSGTWACIPPAGS